MRYCVIKDTTTVIDGSRNADNIMLQNAINAGFIAEQVEILNQQQYEERKSTEPKPEPEINEVEKLRLEQAQANAELVQLIMTMGGV